MSILRGNMDSQQLSKAEKRLAAIRKNRKCKKLSINASKEEILNAHKIKMKAKEIFRERQYERFSGPAYITANIGANHPDYGMTVRQHEEEKVSRQHIL